MTDPGNPNPPEASLRDWREHAVSLVAGAVASLLMLRGLLAAPAVRFVGDWQSDGVLPAQWTIDWIGRRVAHFVPFGRTTGVFAPVGFDPLALADGAALALPAPFVAVLGWPLGANTFTLALLVLNVVAVSWVGRTVGLGRLPSLLAGLATGLSPFVVTELTQGRYEGATVAFLALGVGSWIRLVFRPEPRRAWMFAAAAGLTTLMYVWYGVVLAITAFIVLALALRARRLVLNGASLTGPVAQGAGAALVCSVPGFLLAAGGDATAAERRVPDPISLDYSLPLRWIFGTEGASAVPAAISWLLLALAVWGVFARRRAIAPWVLAALAWTGFVGWVLSLGPRMVTAGGPILDSHLPFYLLFSVPFPSFVHPHQLALPLVLAIAVLAGHGAEDLGRWLPVPRWVLPALALVLAPAELAARGVPLEPRIAHLAETPGWVANVQALGEGAILALPLAPELQVTQQSLLLQRVSGHPAVEGPRLWLDRARPRAWDSFVEKSSFLAEILRFERGHEVDGDPTRANYFRYQVADVSSLTERGVRWVLIWESNYADPIKPLSRAERQLFEDLCGKPAVTGEGVRVYDLRAHAAKGEVQAPPWRMPEGVRGGDGTRRMSARHPSSDFFERAAAPHPALRGEGR